MGSQKHIYEYVSSSGSHRFCTIRLSVAGYSSSGSHRACIIRLSVAGYSSSGPHRVCIIRLSVAGYSSYRFGLGRVCSSALFFSLPIRRDLSLNSILTSIGARG